MHINWNHDSFERKDEAERRYSQVLVKPVEQSNVRIFYRWLQQQQSLTTQQVSFVLAALIGFICFILYVLIFIGFSSLFISLASLVLHMFSIVCSFFWLAIYFRKSWTAISIYVLFCACYAGEILGHLLSDCDQEDYINQPVRILAELFAICVASLSSSLETRGSVFVIWFLSIMRYVACSVLTVNPQLLRPMIAYFCGVVGIIMAKYVETIFQPAVPALYITQDGKIPAIKRRRSSSSTVSGHNNVNQKQGRRTSLPAMTLKSQVIIVIITCN